MRMQISCNREIDAVTIVDTLPPNARVLVLCANRSTYHHHRIPRITDQNLLNDLAGKLAQAERKLEVVIVAGPLLTPAVTGDFWLCSKRLVYWEGNSGA